MRKIIKANFGTLFSSSPLTSLNSTYSTNLNPNFSNALQLGLNLLVPGSQEIINNYDRNIESLKFNLGLDLSHSSDPGMKLFSNKLLEESMSRLPKRNLSNRPPSLIDKFNNSTFGKNYGAYNAGTNVVNSILGGFVEPKWKETTKTVNNALDTVFDVAGNIPVFGKFAKLAYGAGKILNYGTNLVLGDKVATGTALDLGLNNAITGWNLGLINSLGGKNAHTITLDTDTRANLEAGYSGAYNTIDEALSKSGERFGIAGKLTGGLRKANRLVDKGNTFLESLAMINSNTQDRFAIKDYMASVNANKRNLELLGDNLQLIVSVGKHGLSLKTIQTAKDIVKKFLKGGTLKDPFTIYLNSLPENQRDSTDYRVRDYWEFNGRPKNFEEAITKGMFTQQEDGWHANSVQENPNTGEIEFMKSDKHPSHQKEVDWYYSDDGADFRSKYDLVKSSPYWKYVKKKKEFIPELYFVDELQPDIPEFKEGGKVNVIPEGALHARLHHMDNAENLTKKGIPVVSEKENGELEQQCEIERGEIILRLEVVEKLEDIMKQYKENLKDELAIEAGKLLTEEILNNTIDNTNSLL